MRMSKYSNTDHYTDPATGILRNRLGIASEEELKQAEADFAAARSFELSITPLKGCLDLEHLKAIHRYIFKDLYEWAGELRDIDISKGNNFFAHHAHIASAASDLFLKLEQEKHLANLSKETFSERAAFYLGEINAIHPFREGNGRTQREFISHLAYNNGYFIDWRNVEQKKMIEASAQSFKGIYSGLIACILPNLNELDIEKP